MQRLPDVVTSTLTLSLPLCGGTARRLAAALVDSRDDRASQPLLADALARDPVLVLWALAKSHQLGLCELRTIDALAGWLATAALDKLHLPPLAERSSAASRNGDSGAAGAAWVALAARSVGVAALAAEIARQRRLDDQAAHLLGLVHLAPEWLAAAGGLTNPSLDVLPPWIAECLKRIGPSPPAAIASPADCTSLAVHLAQTDDPLKPLPCDFVFDRQAHAAHLQTVRDDWLPDPAGDLLAHLVEKLRRLRDLECNFARTLEAEKLESLKELAYGAGHEINNPLANISARAQTLLQLEPDPDRRRMLASINAQAFRAHEMIADMMLFARPPGARMESFDVAALLARLQAELCEPAAQQRTQIVLDVPPAAVEVVADENQIAVALRSLCTNALEALVTGGRIELALAQPTRTDENVRITVSDNGPGIPPEIRPHIFDPYFSGREAGRGLGLGLSKCWRIVTLHRGRVDVDSPGGRGAVFTVMLPLGNAR